MLKLPARINSKPQYILHPSRAVRRALHRFPPAGGQLGQEVTKLPWGLELEVQRSDAIGYSILVGSVFDPCVTEALYRLIDPGETVIDAGANIGYVSSLAAVRAGPTGRVLSFEPHPAVFATLQGNVRRWAGHPVAAVEARQIALSDKAGQGELSVGPEFHLNMGLASLRSGEPGEPGDQVVKVELATLDETIGDQAIGVMKIDVEGHEPELLEGARRLLGANQIRDLVFEDHEPYPSRATRLLEEAGYRLFALDNDLLGIVLLPPSQREDAPAWPGPSYLASCQPDRAIARMNPRWWRTPGIFPGSWQRVVTALARHER
jgi:FkbM family methyltransferase